MKLAFDVGFHLGFSSRKLLDLGWSVIGVEANPQLAGGVGEVDGLRLITAAVASKSGFVDFFINDGKEDWSSLALPVADRNGAGVRRITASAVTLSMLIEHFGLPQYLKIDIEGGEIDALAGLGTHRPTVISIEVDHIGLTSEQLFALAKEMGYGWYAWSPQHSNEVTFPSVGWTSIAEPSETPSDWCDLFLSLDPNWSFGP